MKNREDLKEQIASLTPAQRALLEQRLRQKAAQPSAARQIARAPNRGEAPLSFAQQRLWFLDQLAPGNPFYNMPRAYRVRGALRPDILRRALSEIVSRHEALRTTFAVVDGQPVQRIAADQPLELSVVDVSGFPQPERERRLEEWLVTEARRPFDLTRGPLLRAGLLRLAEQEHVLLLTMHHIVSDGWSLGILIQEIAHFYDEFSGGHPEALPELPIQYADFARWQREWLSGEELERQLSYWKRQLADLPVLELSTDRPRPFEQTFRGARVRTTFPAALTAAVKDLAQREGATLYMALLAAFQALLSRYTGQEDIVVGSPIANRTRGEIEGLIGFFVNTLVMRTSLSGDPSFRELIRRVREVALEAYAHQDLPFEKLVEELQPERDLGQNPVVQVTFALQNAPAAELELSGLKLTSLGVDSGATHFDLEVHLWESGGKLDVVLVYSTDLFDASTIQRLMDHFGNLLEAAVGTPDARISRLTMITPAERKQLLFGWNEAAVFPQDSSLQHRFEERVRRGPDAQAIVLGEERLTYGELNARANRLARALRRMGVGRDVLVGLCIERSLELVVGILGILKAGGAYVPLDPSYPRERLHFMAQDTGMKLVVTQSRLAELLEETQARRICLDTEWEEIARESPEDLASGGRPEDLAYVIYTSGSTGKPKGVLVTHGNVLRLFDATEEWFGFDEKDVWTLFHSYGFDFSVWELWGALLYGGRLVVVPYLISRSPEDFYRLLRAEGVTVLNQTPSAFFQLLPVDAAAQETSDLALRLVIFGGEALDIRALKPWFDRHGQERPRLVNMYGITETTVHVTYRPLTAQDARGTASVLGRPIPDLQLYILDRALEPVPLGVRGEIFVGGAGLARGYWNRPELTAERFLADPFRPGPGARLYRTGDLARRRPDGDIEYLGRGDDQVKIRGFRIELGEIEEALRQQASVSAAFVLLDRDAAAGERLIAYVVPAAGDSGQESGESEADPADQVDQWRTVYEQLYSPSAVSDPSFNIVGWNSSYTGQPLPPEEMREWVDTTVERILALKPSRVLEIGCGTGLLLLRVAPHCSRYTGTDFSPKVLEQLEAVVRRPEQRLPPVQLLAKSAEDFEGIPRRDFDTVILNSVVQYFPSVEYLLRVIEGAVEALSEGGAIFVGDVRSLPLLEAFHLSVELERAPASLPTEELRRRVRRRAVQEEELVLDPGFFLALRRHLPRITRVEVVPKAGRYDNELNRYRYDVVLHVGPVSDSARDLSWLNGRQQELTEDRIRRLLAEEQPPTLGVRDVPNARVARDVRALELINGGEPPQTAGELRIALEQLPQTGIHPADLLAWSAELPYRIDLSWSSSSPRGEFDVAFRREGSSRSADRPVRFPGESHEAKSWRTYANNPLQATAARKLIPKLRAHLRETLPEYMMPSAFVVLDELPLTPNGKVDRRALPPPDQANIFREGVFVAPRDPIEEVLAGIWSEVLGVERIGVEDNFFALGGHSLLATQVISRIRETSAVELPLRELFESPTVAGLARKIASARQGVTGLPAEPLSPAAREEELPLSFAQQRLWFLDQLEPGNAFYITWRVLRLVGNLDLRALEKAFAAIVRRHESLRTRFESVEGRPVQIVEEDVRFDLPLVDLTALREEEGKAAAARRAAQEIARPFELSAVPLLRATALRLSEDEHVLVIAMHHIVSDGWSMSILVRELAAFYEESSGGRPAALPELPIQYADFARWQREWLRGEALEKRLAYWRKQLSSLPVLELPTDHPRPPAQSFRGARHSISLSKKLTAALKELSQREGATLYMTLLAAFQTLLMRYTGQEDVAVGSPIAGRNRAEIEGLIGFFVNTLVLRTDLSGDPSFRELLARVREVALGAYDHQDLPFEKLVEELQPQRDLGHNPLFQVLFALQNAPASSFELAGLKAIPLSLEGKTARFDLEVYLWEKPDGLTCTFVYATDLFDSGTILRMMGHYQTLLEEVVRDANLPVWKLAILPEAERRQVLEEWNETAKEYPFGKTVHGLFEDQVERASEAEAVVFGKERLTYGQLNERANRLARFLEKLGVGPGALVGLCVERSLEMVVSLLGILKAGGAYVPLDPSYPRERLRFMLEDAGARVVLTQESLSGVLPRGDFQFVKLDADRGEIEREIGENLERRGASNDLAYVIYTSGSTGVPKGVAIEHHSTVALLAWARQLFSDAELAGVLASTSICFDLSVFELFAPLVWGGKVILAQNALELRDLPAAGEVRLINTVPSAMAELLRMGDLPESVETVNLAGEPLAAALVREILRRGRVRRVFDLYGPTEDTTYSTCAPRSGEGAVTIGRPIANKRVYILDAHLQPMPIGVPGDLYVAGAGVARGYLNRPELTSEKFLADPFHPGERMYRTGDRGRFLPDGNVQFLGRLDHQVKIRGYRIEIGEIEEALARHSEVRDSAVAARQEESGDKRLVGYVVPRDGASISVTPLREFLKKTLPDYMIPSAFVFLDALPLTPNGKVDRAALPAPEQTRPGLEDAFVAPRNAVEQTVARIWGQVLGLDEVGVHDNFFELGGHSLLATLVFARLQKAFPVAPPLRALFEKPTVAELSGTIEELRQGRAGPPRSPILPVSRQALSREPGFVGDGGDVSDES